MFIPQIICRVIAMLMIIIQNIIIVVRINIQPYILWYFYMVVIILALILTFISAFALFFSFVDVILVKFVHFSKMFVLCL